MAGGDQREMALPQPIAVSPYRTFPRSTMPLSPGTGEVAALVPLRLR